MKKSALSSASRKAREIEPFDKRRVDLTKFKPDIAPGDWKNLLATRPGRVFPPFFTPIEVLSVTKTVGRGRTNITIAAPLVVQADSATPRASFNRQVLSGRNPVIQIHFEPVAYGFATVGTYVVDFVIEVFGQGTFNVLGFAGAGTIVNAGTKVLSGQSVVSVILKDMPAAQQSFVLVEQTAGAPWNWFSTRISLPPPVITQ